VRSHHSEPATAMCSQRVVTDNQIMPQLHTVSVTVS
jgi:hypothetical protein